MYFNKYLYDKNAQWNIFILLVLVIVAKSIVFSWLCFPELQGNALKQLISIPQKIVPALFLGAFVFVAKRQWWTIILNVLVDIWIIQDQYTLFCKNVKSQTIHGNSADGQLITITGLRPIADGVVCNSFSKNEFPSIAQCYSTSSIINPTPGAWKQTEMTKAYHFHKLIEPTMHTSWSDRDISDELIQYIDTASQPFCTLGITISSHTPFSFGTIHPIYTIDGMPAKLIAYLNCLAYADSCIGAVYEHIRKSKKQADNTVLVITGDHTIFRFPDKELDNYARSAGINFQSSKTSIPLIINAHPNAHAHTQVADSCYQMDIYSTIMHTIGCQDYYWKGFGVNLWDKDARSQRTISEERAYELSNQIIKSNYFATK